MIDDARTLPDNPVLLKGLIASMASELTSRDVLIAKLQHQLSGLRRQQFGSRSESLDQLELMLEEEEIARGAAARATTLLETEKRQPKRRPLPEGLPRNETVLMPGDACQTCGGVFRQLGEDVTEELEYVPGRFVVNRIMRPIAWQAMQASPRRAYGLQMLREDQPGAFAFTPHRTWPPWARPWAWPRA